MFTRRHYEAIARVLRDAAINEHARRGLTEDFAAIFAADNSRFRPAKFRDAYGCPPLTAEASRQAAE